MTLVHVEQPTIQRLGDLTKNDPTDLIRARVLETSGGVETVTIVIRTRLQKSEEVLILWRIMDRREPNSDMDMNMTE